MVIIPYNTHFVQAGIPPTTHETQTNYNFQGFSGKTRVQKAAFELYDMGLNILPQPIGRKGGYPWKRLQYTRLNRNDENFGLDVLFAGQCNLAVMCGATSGNLFIIDCESMPILEYHMSQLHKRKIPLWIVQTARGGHIYLRAAEGAVHNVKSGVMVDAEIRGQHSYVLAPPSLHPTGAVYSWLVRETAEIPVVAVDKIDWLKDSLGQPIQLSFDAQPKQTQKGNWSYRSVSPCSNLAYDTRDYVQNGHSISEGSRNNRLFKAACDMNGNGYSQSEVEAILIPVALGSGLSAFEINHTINSAFSKSRTPTRPDKKPLDDSSMWHHALLWASHHQWQGRTSGTTRALCLAIIERCRVASNENGVFRASIRELATLARLGTITVQKALQRLERQRVIQRCGNDKTSGASLWRFTTSIINVGKKIELNLNTVKIAPHWLRFSVLLFNSDAVERGALGHSVTYIYQYMNTLETPMMPSEIAFALGLTINQVNYALRKLRNLDLLRRLEKGWLPIQMTYQEFESYIEEVTDVAGKGKRREARFRRERQLFAGRILHDRRLRVEQDTFSLAVIRQTRCQQLLDDPLIALGLELGATIQLGDEGYLVADRE